MFESPYECSIQAKELQSKLQIEESGDFAIHVAQYFGLRRNIS